jgi:soluble lytic murein transglycosylase-like protein
VAKVAVAAPPPGPPPSAGTIEAIIYAAAKKYGVSYPWMLKIARCESGLNPRAYNPAGPYIGLFQFLPSTFRAHGGTNIYDPVQQSNITAFMLSHGGAGAWGCA